MNEEIASRVFHPQVRSTVFLISQLIILRILASYTSDILVGWGIWVLSLIVQIIVYNKLVRPKYQEYYPDYITNGDTQ